MVAAIYNSPEGETAILSWYDTVVQRLPLKCESCYVPTRFGDTHILVGGNPDGLPVILLHGLNNNAAIWQPQLPALADFRIYAVDIVGHPGRSAPMHLSLFGNAYAHWLVDVLDGLKLDSAAVVGLSLGGYLTMKLGALAPQRISKAVLLSPAGLARLRLEIGWKFAVSMLSKSSLEDAQQLIKRIYLTPGVTIKADTGDALKLLELVSRHLKPIRHPRQFLDAVLAGLPLPAYEARKFISPTLLMIGDHDALFDAQAVVQRGKQVLPGLVAAEIVPNAGHAMIYEYPDKINTRLVRFLQEGA